MLRAHSKKSTVWLLEHTILSISFYGFKFFSKKV